MPKFPNVEVTSRIETGGIRQMNTIEVSGPRQISPSLFRPNTMDAPVYPAPVAKQPHPMTLKAIQDFGNTLVDVTMSVADRRARLFAYERNEKQKREIEGVLKNGENAFLLTKELDATKRREEVEKRIQEIHKETLEGVSNHVKLHLFKEAGAATNAAMNLIANHVMFEERAATISAQKGKIEDLQKELNEAVGITPQYRQGRIDTVFSSLIFANEVERQDTQDKLYLGTAKSDVSRIIVPGEFADNGELDRRVDSLGEKIKSFRPYLSESANIQAIGVYHQAVDMVESEKTSRRLKAERANQEVNKTLVNMFAKIRMQGGPFPKEVGDALVYSGLMDWRALELEKARWKDGQVDTDKIEAAGLFVDLSTQINRNATYNDWFLPMTKAIADGLLTKSDANTLLTHHESMKKELYRNYFGRLDNQLRAWIITTSPYAQFTRDVEDNLYRAASTEAMQKLYALKLNDRLNDDEFDIVRNELNAKYGIAATIKKQSTFMDIPRGSTTVVAGPEDLAKVARHIEERRKKEDIDPLTYNALKSRVDALSILFERQQILVEEIKSGKKASEEFPGYPEQEGDPNRPVTNWEDQMKMEEITDQLKLNNVFGVPTNF